MKEEARNSLKTGLLYERIGNGDVTLHKVGPLQLVKDCYAIFLANLPKNGEAKHVANHLNKELGAYHMPPVQTADQSKTFILLDTTKWKKKDIKWLYEHTLAKESSILKRALRAKKVSLTPIELA